MAEFVSDTDLDYGRTRFRFEPGRTLTLDDAYRANQLPLLRADPDPTAGRYARSRLSAVVFVPSRLFDGSEVFQQIWRALQSSSLASSIDWAMFERRRERLHLTLCGRLEEAMTRDEAARRLETLRSLPPFAVLVRGPWVGEAFNRGRIYLPVYPEKRDGVNAISRVQRQLGWRVTGFYGIGAFNLLRDLDEGETRDLARLVEDCGPRTIGELSVQTVALLETNDDLILSGRVVGSIELGGSG